MRVLLVSNYQPDEQRSMLSYADFLRRGLEPLGHSVEVIHPPARLGRLVSRSHKLFKWLGYVDKYLIFPHALRKKSRTVDLVHICDHSNSCYQRWTGATPTVITVHDMLAIRSAMGHFPQNPTGRMGQLLQRWILNGLRQAPHIITVSSKTKQDVEALTKGKSSISVVHHGLNWSYSRSSRAEIEGVRNACGLAPGDEYLLHLGGNQWYKNRLGVMKIALELRKHKRFLRVKLVMAGKAWTPEIWALRDENSFSDAIEFVNPDARQIQALYSGALAFLFPSLEEGFGWPILEAQACGCLVITSSRLPMTEVAGAGAILVDPANTTSAAQTIAENFHRIEILKQAGWDNLKRFAIDDMMKRYEAVYASVVAGERGHETAALVNR
jgi:glycosyltransferase involved in cell wall biosynthesis